MLFPCIPKRLPCPQADTNPPSCRCPHTWALGLRICQEGPGQGVPSSEPLMWVPTRPLPPPDSCRWDTHGLVAPGRDPTGCYLGSRSHQCLPVLLCRRAEELYCTSRQWGEFLSPGTGFLIKSQEHCASPKEMSPPLPSHPGPVGQPPSPALGFSSWGGGKACQSVCSHPLPVKSSVKC